MQPSSAHRAGLYIQQLTGYRTLGRRAGKALAVLKKLYQPPIVTVDAIAGAAGISFANANSLAKPWPR